jgi:uncharacterized protein YeeX (DUF496 family)
MSNPTTDPALDFIWKALVINRAAQRELRGLLRRLRRELQSRVDESTLTPVELRRARRAIRKIEDVIGEAVD